jgi:hypothetical protein
MIPPSVPTQDLDEVAYSDLTISIGSLMVKRRRDSAAVGFIEGLPLDEQVRSPFTALLDRFGTEGAREIILLVFVAQPSHPLRRINTRAL